MIAHARIKHRHKSMAVLSSTIIESQGWRVAGVFL
jgi:hypothetical protein